MSDCRIALHKQGRPSPRTCARCGLGPCTDPFFGATPQQRTDRQMQAAMRALVEVFPGCALVLLVAPVGGPPGARVNYVSNGQREEIVTMMKEVVARFEGRAHDAPGKPQ